MTRRPRRREPALEEHWRGAYDTHVKLNLRRGLFRLWIVFGTLFVIAVCVRATGSIITAFDKASPRKDWLGKPLVPVDCPGEEYLPADNPKQDGRCWRTLAGYQALHPNEKHDDSPLVAALYEKAGIPLLDPFDAWAKVFQTAGIALGVPLAVLLLGQALLWAISGFSPVDPRPA